MSSTGPKSGSVGPSPRDMGFLLKILVVTAFFAISAAHAQTATTGTGDIGADVVPSATGTTVGSGSSSVTARPDRQTLRDDQKRLDALQKLFEQTQTKGQQFGDEFWRASKRIGNETGPRVVHAVMQRATSWHDEEDLVFVPLVALLPRKPTLELLHEYEHSRRASDRFYAQEFLTDLLDMVDTKEGVRRFSGSNP